MSRESRTSTEVLGLRPGPLAAGKLYHTLGFSEVQGCITGSLTTEYARLLAVWAARPSRMRGYEAGNFRTH